MFQRLTHNLARRAGTALCALTMLSVLSENSAHCDETSRPALAGGIYDKPYLREMGGRVSVGGYMDMEFERNEGGESSFDQHRLVPFLTGYVSERVTFSTEIEFEHGGNPSADGEVKIEYAVLDFALADAISFRGGVLLSPLGAFNVLHDSPLNDLTARPIVSRQLIPSTLSESGMGFFGKSPLGENWVLGYELYVVNGFNEGIINTDGVLRVRGGRGSQKADNNRNKAITARLGLSPRIGIDLGISVHSGTYDSQDEHRLNIAALDAKGVFGALEIQGELATVQAELDAAANPQTAGGQWGAYLQTNHHILHDFMMPGSIVTLAVRGDWVDFDSDAEGDSENGLTLGVNFRPTEETVFKADYNLRWTTDQLGARNSAPGRFFFSFATYF